MIDRGTPAPMILPGLALGARSLVRTADPTGAGRVRCADLAPPQT